MDVARERRPAEGMTEIQTGLVAQILEVLANRRRPRTTLGGVVRALVGVNPVLYVSEHAVSRYPLDVTPETDLGDNILVGDSGGPAYRLPLFLVS